MRAATQVEEVACAIHADLVAFDLVCDQLELVVLAPPAELVNRLLARKHLVHERDIGLGELAHARLDCRQVRLRDRLAAEVEVVVEAVLHRGPDAVRGAWVQLGHGGGEQMRGGVPERLQRVAGGLVLPVFGHRVVQYMDGLTELGPPHPACGRPPHKVGR